MKKINAEEILNNLKDYLDILSLDISNSGIIIKNLFIDGDGELGIEIYENININTICEEIQHILEKEHNVKTNSELLEFNATSRHLIPQIKRSAIEATLEYTCMYSLRKDDEGFQYELENLLKDTDINTVTSEKNYYKAISDTLPIIDTLDNGATCNQKYRVTFN